MGAVPFGTQPAPSLLAVLYGQEKQRMKGQPKDGTEGPPLHFVLQVWFCHSVERRTLLHRQHLP